MQQGGRVQPQGMTNRAGEWKDLSQERLEKGEHQCRFQHVRGYSSLSPPISMELGRHQARCIVFSRAAWLLGTGYRKVR